MKAKRKGPASATTAESKRVEFELRRLAAWGEGWADGYVAGYKDVLKQLQQLRRKAKAK